MDQFVIIESDHTLTNRPKPYLFELYKQRYQPWLDKIRHVKHKSSLNPDPWVNVYQQRDALSTNIQDLDHNDIVIFNDADEIIRNSFISELKSSQHTIFGFCMTLSNFKFNYIRTGSGSLDIWTTAVRAGWVQRFGGQMLRNQLNNLLDLPFQSKSILTPYKWLPQDVKIFQHGGWHFSYLGDTDFIIDKLQNTVHQEDNVNDVINNIDIELSILAGKTWNVSLPYTFETVDLDSYFPKSCLLFPQHCLPNSGQNAIKTLDRHVT